MKRKKKIDHPFGMHTFQGMSVGAIPGIALANPVVGFGGMALGAYIGNRFDRPKRKK